MVLHEQMQHRFIHDAGIPLFQPLIPPAHTFLQECVRWGDQWLKKRDTGIVDEPMLHLFMQDHAMPQSAYATRAGRWVSELTWPSPNIERVSFFPGKAGRLTKQQTDTTIAPVALCSPLFVGVHGGKWCSYAVP